MWSNLLPDSRSSLQSGSTTPHNRGLHIIGEGGKDVEEHLAHRIDRVINARPQREPDAARNESVGDEPGVRDRARQSVELGHNERVTRADGGKSLVEAGPGPVRAGQPVIGVDPVGSNTELSKRGFLGGEVLFVGGAAGVADEGGRHGQMCNVKPPLNDRVVVLSI